MPTDEEKLALYDTMFAYAGTYTVDAEKVVHHIDGLPFAMKSAQVRPSWRPALDAIIVC